MIIGHISTLALVEIFRPIWSTIQALSSTILRVGLSPLKHHKKRHNFKVTPTDTYRCQMSTETTEHFLVYCNFYTEERNDKFQAINPILGFVSA